MLARVMINLGSQLISLTFLARQKKTTLAATYQSTMRERITVPAITMLRVISYYLYASAFLLS